MSSKLAPPDFDVMVEKAEEIGHLSKDVALLDITIKAKEAEIVRSKTSVVAGKAPSMEYLKATDKYTGVDSELIPLRQQLADLESRLDEAKLIFQIMRDQVSVYITESAAQRASIL